MTRREHHASPRDRRFLRLAASIPIAVALVVVGSASNASASVERAAATCEEGSRDSASAVGDTTTVTEPAPSTLSRGAAHTAIIKLRYSAESSCVWAWIGGGPPTVGSVVWIDRKAVGPEGRTDSSLGIRGVRFGNESTYGPAYQLRAGIEAYRACGRFDQTVEPSCTLWFDGTRLFDDEGGPGPTYVALGDSFAAGEGAPSADGYEQGTDTPTNLCHRSDAAYGPIVGRELGLGTTFIACSGGKTTDYWTAQKDRQGQPAQLEMLSKNAELVTLTFGGNNIGFANVARNCAVAKEMRDPRNKASCNGEIADASAQIQSLADSPDSTKTIGAVLRDVRVRAPQARILLLGYPRLFPESPNKSCTTGFPGVEFAVDEMTAVNRLVSDLNATLQSQAAASGTGASFVDVGETFDGHDACAADNDRWINLLRDPRLSTSRNESFHPTPAGQAAFAQRVLACQRHNECE